MRMMTRNKSVFYYALYDRKVPLIDEYGNETGEYEVIHQNPKAYRANISAAKDEVNTQQFGVNEAYDKVDCPPIDEYTVLWVDKVPLTDSKGALVINVFGEVKTPHDYIVKKVARSLNSVSIAISKVNISG